MYFLFLNSCASIWPWNKRTSSNQKIIGAERKVLMMKKKMLDMVAAALEMYYQTFSVDF